MAPSFPPFKTLAQVVLDNGLGSGQLPDGSTFSLLTPDIYPWPELPAGTPPDPVHAWQDVQKDYMARIFGDGFANLPFGYTLPGAPSGAEAIAKITPAWLVSMGMDPNYQENNADNFL